MSGIEGSSSNHWRWGMRKAYGNEGQPLQNASETLGQGFPSFYSSEFPPLVVGDSAKKHYSVPNSRERVGKPAIKVLDAPTANQHGVRKKLLDEPPTMDDAPIIRKKPVGTFELTGCLLMHR